LKYSIIIVIHADSYGSTKVKIRSGGASPRQLNIDPMALLPGVRLSPRGHHNVEAAVSFDHPAKLDAILHNAGKVSGGSCSETNWQIFLGC
jgi:hypothetical protein